MPLVLPLVPGQRSTPEAVVVEEVRSYALVAIFVLTTKRCSRRLRRVLLFGLRRVGGVTKCFELVVVDDAYARDPVTPVAASVCRGSSSYEV
jgi:hypothetical protein